MTNGNGGERLGDGATGASMNLDGGLGNDRRELSSEEIAARAYEIYEREGRSDGQDMDHWFRAESELRAERQQGQSPAQTRQERQDLPRSARQHQPSAGA